MHNGTAARGQEAEHHVITGLDVGHPWTDLHDDAGSLVTADERGVRRDPGQDRRSRGARPIGGRNVGIDEHIEPARAARLERDLAIDYVGDVERDKHTVVEVGVRSAHERDAPTVGELRRRLLLIGLARP